MFIVGGGVLFGEPCRPLCFYRVLGVAGSAVTQVIMTARADLSVPSNCTLDFGQKRSQRYPLGTFFLSQMYLRQNIPKSADVADFGISAQFPSKEIVKSSKICNMCRFWKLPLILTILTPPTFASGHTALNTPDPIRTRKLSSARPGQYWGGGPPGKSLGCCWLFSRDV